MKKRLISTLMALSMAIAPVHVFSTSAEYIPGEKQQAENRISEQYMHIPELVDTLTQIKGVGDIDDLWYMCEDDNIEGAFWCVVEKSYSDYVMFVFNKPEDDNTDLVKKLYEVLGYNEKIVIEENDKYFIGGTANVRIDFLTDNHELNYRIVEKAASILNKTYSLNLYEAGFERADFYATRICMPKVPVNTPAELDVLTKEDSAKYNKMLSDNGIRVQYKDTVDVETFDVSEDSDYYGAKIIKYAVFPEDMTVKEKLDYTLFAQNEFDTHIVVDGSTMSVSPSSAGWNRGVICDDIEFDQNHWLDGDANEDGSTNIADATAIVQAIGNPDKYKLTPQGEFNADTDGNGLTGLDAIAVQMKLISK